MRKLVFLAAALATGAAQADFQPRVISDKYVATITLNGATTTVEQSGGQHGPLTDVATQIMGIPYSLRQGFNTFMAQGAATQGGTFIAGELTGDINVLLQPNASGTAAMTMSGISYNARTRYSGTKYGIFTYDCTNYLGLNNITMVGQYGSASGSLPSNTVGMTANTTSTTNCDSNASWILPFVGSKLINKMEGTADAQVLASMTTAMAGVKDALFFKRDQNLLVGLNKLIPADKVIQLPTGPFPIGQYVQGNLPYLLANSTVNIKLGKGAEVAGVSGWMRPTDGLIVGDFLNLTMTVPGVISFTVQLTQHDEVEWSWVCNLQRPYDVCYQP